ncbi:hypothetical protein PR048_024578 [Dryococelus australis]|uniref:Uncharacterized protein n=1 Tax=Dryococelus australis TaxID=614101 RepID=A0ABQ9GP06_9NEOP|nr:hypothetical protein PR048_024578 [Dryococelus australis]
MFVDLKPINWFHASFVSRSSMRFEFVWIYGHVLPHHNPFLNVLAIGKTDVHGPYHDTNVSMLRGPACSALKIATQDHCILSPVKSAECHSSRDSVDINTAQKSIVHSRFLRPVGRARARVGWCAHVVRKGESAITRLSQPNPIWRVIIPIALRLAVMWRRLISIPLPRAVKLALTDDWCLIASKHRSVMSVHVMSAVTEGGHRYTLRTAYRTGAGCKLRILDAPEPDTAQQASGLSLPPYFVCACGGKNQQRSVFRERDRLTLNPRRALRNVYPAQLASMAKIVELGVPRMHRGIQFRAKVNDTASHQRTANFEVAADQERINVTIEKAFDNLELGIIVNLPVEIVNQKVQTELVKYGHLFAREGRTCNKDRATENLAVDKPALSTPAQHSPRADCPPLKRILQDTCCRTWFLYKLLQGLMHEPVYQPLYESSWKIHITRQQFASSEAVLLTGSQCDRRAEDLPCRRRRGASPRPSDYGSATLPLSYEGRALRVRDWSRRATTTHTQNFTPPNIPLSPCFVDGQHGRKRKRYNHTTPPVLHHWDATPSAPGVDQSLVRDLGHPYSSHACGGEEKLTPPPPPQPSEILNAAEQTLFYRIPRGWKCAMSDAKSYALKEFHEYMEILHSASHLSWRISLVRAGLRWCVCCYWGVKCGSCVVSRRRECLRIRLTWLYCPDHVPGRGRKLFYRSRCDFRSSSSLLHQVQELGGRFSKGPCGRLLTLGIYFIHVAGTLEAVPTDVDESIDGRACVTRQLRRSSYEEPRLRKSWYREIKPSTRALDNATGDVPKLHIRGPYTLFAIARLPPRLPGSITGRVTLGFSRVGIVPDDVAGRRVFFEGFPVSPRSCIPLLHFAPRSTHFGSQDVWLFTSRSRELMRVSEGNVEQRRNARAGETGDPRSQAVRAKQQKTAFIVGAVLALGQILASASLIYGVYKAVPKVHVGREHCTPVQSLALRDDWGLDARGSGAVKAPSFFGFKGGKKTPACYSRILLCVQGKTDCLVLWLVYGVIGYLLSKAATIFLIIKFFSGERSAIAGVGVLAFQSGKCICRSAVEVLKTAEEDEVPECEGAGKRETPRKPADMRHRPSRFPHSRGGIYHTPPRQSSVISYYRFIGIEPSMFQYYRIPLFAYFLMIVNKYRETLQEEFDDLEKLHKRPRFSPLARNKLAAHSPAVCSSLSCVWRDESAASLNNEVSRVREVSMEQRRNASAGRTADLGESGIVPSQPPPGFPWNLPFPLPLNSGAAPFSPHFARIGSQDLDGGESETRWKWSGARMQGRGKRQFEITPASQQHRPARFLCCENLLVHPPGIEPASPCYGRRGDVKNGLALRLNPMREHEH